MKIRLTTALLLAAMLMPAGMMAKKAPKSQKVAPKTTVAKTHPNGLRMQ